MMKHFLFAVSFCCMLGSCSTITGNGNITTETRNVGEFNSIDVSGGLKVYISQSADFAVRVETDENIQEVILTEVKDNVLRIKQENMTNLNATRIKIYVSAPMFKNFDASGASTIISENKINLQETITIDVSGSSDAKLELSTPQIAVELSGASSVTLKGETRDVSIDGSGSSDIHAFDLLAETINLDLSGASNADVFASKNIQVEASGASNVRYKGNASVSKDVSGAAGVQKME